MTTMWQQTARTLTRGIAARSLVPSRATSREAISWIHSSVLIPHQRLPFTTSWSTSQGFLRPGPGRDMAIAAAAEARRARSAAATSPAPSDTTLLGGTGGSTITEDGIDEDDEDDEEGGDDDDDDDDEDVDLESKEGVVVIHTKNAPVRPTTQQNHVYKEIVLLDTDFRERFIKGGGNGGQKINKTNSNVELKHYETGIVVQCQATRSLPQNRKLARRILIARLDEYYNGSMSKRARKAEKIRDKKRRAARKSAKKYAAIAASKESEVGENEARATSSTNTTTAAGVIEPLDMTTMTLDEILVMDNKKPSRRKSKK
ncbi:hypothetical protein BGZ73_005079 [Actinomortierella ambigua]|nr:hypothetical protein BGZ73_005079 [Actinomortierella ambigua]